MRTSTIVLVGIALWCAGLAAAAEEVGWPEITRDQRPWAYNWWLGSAVDRDNIARELQRYSDAGLGGVHVIPIYGAKGAEKRYLTYLSKEWLEMLRFAISEAARHGMGLDMTTGSGWCFGGPDITPELGNLGAGVLATNIPSGGAYSRPAGEIIAAVRMDAGGHAVPLASAAGPLEFRATDSPATICSLVVRPTGRKVKRAAPGGEGLMINPFSPASMRCYLESFDRRFGPAGAPPVRAMYHDSYEYYHGGREFDAGWSPEFLDAFERRRGYRFQDRFFKLIDLGDPEAGRRILADYRETLSDLMIEEVFPQWTRWCSAKGIKTRNQAHGSPANILDLYALADVPETEMFGRGERDPLRSGFDARFGEGDRDPLISKFASSAAHVTGRRLVAAETGTWLAEHFCETLEELKCLVDLLFVSGVNHVVYHGCCYSPDDAPWPGWIFYAATQMNPRNTIWKDAVALNAYIARCQSVLQSGEPDNDVLLYWPIYDLWHEPVEKPGVLDPIECGVHDRGWFNRQAIGATARRLWERGHCFDYVSDRQLRLAKPDNGEIMMPGGRYRAILVPPTKFMPTATCRLLADLARGGCTILFQDRLPSDVPGLANLENRRKEMRRALDEFGSFGPRDSVRAARVGKGAVFFGELEGLMAASGIDHETVADLPGVRFIRRKHPRGQYYFIANQGMAVADTWFCPAKKALAAEVMDPMTGDIQEAETCPMEGGCGIHIRLEPGHSVIIRTAGEARTSPSTSTRQWYLPGPNGVTLSGPWRVEFISGGPALPAAYEVGELKSWTDNGDPATIAFAGTAVYRTRFDSRGEGPWILDLGEVRHSARVRINGKDLGIRLMAPYRMPVHDLKQKDNLIEVEVTNLAANRIRDMDSRKIPWRVFNDANVVSIRYKPFDASAWPVFPSGLLGPVRLSSAVASPRPAAPGHGSGPPVRQLP